MTHSDASTLPVSTSCCNLTNLHAVSATGRSAVVQLQAVQSCLGRFRVSWDLEGFLPILLQTTHTSPHTPHSHATRLTRLHYYIRFPAPRHHHPPRSHPFLSHDRLSLPRAFLLHDRAPPYTTMLCDLNPSFSPRCR